MRRKVLAVGSPVHALWYEGVGQANEVLFLGSLNTLSVTVHL